MNEHNQDFNNPLLNETEDKFESQHRDSIKDTGISSSFPQKKQRNLYQNCFYRVFCCLPPNSPYEEESHDVGKASMKSKLPHYLVKSSVDMKEDPKNSSEESNPNEKAHFDKNFSCNNFRNLPSFAKKPSKKHEKPKVFCLEESMKDFPTNKLFLMFNTEKTTYFMTKITQAHFLYSCKEKNGSVNLHPKGSHSHAKGEGTGEKKTKEKTFRFNDNPINVFSLYEKGVKFNTENWEKVCPEKVARHIAQRSKLENYNLVLDAFSGIGGNTLQLAKEWPFVVSVDICEKQLNYLRHNAGVYAINDKIEYVLADFMKLNTQQIKPDLVFLNPPAEVRSNEKFSLFSDIQPDLIEILKKTFEMTKNFILLLPKNVDFQEIIEALYFSIPSNMEQKTVEIELIYINNSIEYVVVHYGDTSQVFQI